MSKRITCLLSIMYNIWDIIIGDNNREDIIDDNNTDEIIDDTNTDDIIDGAIEYILCRTKNHRCKG